MAAAVSSVRAGRRWVVPAVVVRDVHLYAGLFAAPLLALFAVSVPVINHKLADVRGTETRREAAGIVLPSGVESLDGRAGIERVRPALEKLGVTGEAGFVRFVPREQRLIVPVSSPRRETVVDFHLRDNTASIVSRRTGFASASVWLHKAPGPHLANIRGNWVWMRIWKVFADATVGLVLLAGTTGVWLWLILRRERIAGLFCLFAGAATLLGMVYAIAR